MKISGKVAGLMLMAAAVFTGCSSDSPKAAAEKFLNNLNHMDYEGAKTVATEETRNMLDMLAQFSSMMPDSVKEAAKKITVTINEEKILSDTTAYITYTTSENTTEQRLNLVKRSTSEKGDEKWLAQWSKADETDGNADVDIFHEMEGEEGTIDSSTLKNQVEALH